MSNYTSKNNKYNNNEKLIIILTKYNKTVVDFDGKWNYSEGNVSFENKNILF